MLNGHSTAEGCSRGPISYAAAGEAALAETHAQFDLNSRNVIGLADAGVPERVTDVIIALFVSAAIHRRKDNAVCRGWRLRGSAPEWHGPGDRRRRIHPCAAARA